MNENPYEDWMIKRDWGRDIKMLIRQVERRNFLPEVKKSYRGGKSWANHLLKRRRIMEKKLNSRNLIKGV